MIKGQTSLEKNGSRFYFSTTWTHCNQCPSTHMMTSSNGNIFRVTGPLCGEFTGPGEFPTQRPVARSFDVFCYLRLTKRLRKQPWGWWFETPSWSLWRHCNDRRWWANDTIHCQPSTTIHNSYKHFKGFVQVVLYNIWYHFCQVPPCSLFYMRRFDFLAATKQL